MNIFAVLGPVVSKGHLFLMSGNPAHGVAFSEASDFRLGQWKAPISLTLFYNKSSCKFLYLKHSGRRGMDAQNGGLRTALKARMQEQKPKPVVECECSVI